MASPSESEPEAMSSKGVLAGIVLPPPSVDTVGILLFVADEDAHELPFPLTVNEIISLML